MSEEHSATPLRNYFLTTPRLAFSAWTDNDLPLATKIWGDPAVTGLLGGPFSEVAIYNRFRLEIDAMSVHGVQYWLLFLKETGELVGAAGLRHREADTYEMGYYILPPAWGCGYATEAGAAVVEYAFGKVGATGLFGGHHPDNEASGKVLRKLGFQFTHKELYPPTGLIHPCYWLKNSNQA